MNVQEILEDADLLVPNSFSNAKKIQWLNQAQRQLFKEMPGPYSSPPSDIREEQLTFVPRLYPDYHELLSFGIAKRMAERVQDFTLAGEIEARYRQLLQEAEKNTTPKIKKVTIKRNWM